jgi:hypothetical protein
MKETSMASPEEIERRVKDNDTPTTAKRSAAAKRVGELAQRRAAIAEQLSDIERELGDLLAESSDVIGTYELAKFTDIPVADLDRWLNSRKTTRTKRKKSAPALSAANTDKSQDPPTPKTSGPTPMTPEPAAPRSVPVNASARVPAEVT